MQEMPYIHPVGSDIKCSVVQAEMKTSLHASSQDIIVCLQTLKNIYVIQSLIKKIDE